jgi:AcrR family transcriptional regulator
MTVRPGRIKPLPPQQRRAAIIEATVPLLREHGLGVTTRQIAEVAGVAEGTIFRVFADKDALIKAVLETVFDPEPVRRQLQAIDLSAPLEDRIRAAVKILSDRVRSVWQLLAALQTKSPHEHPPHPRVLGKNRAMAAAMGELAALFEPDRARLTFPPATAARMLRGVVFAGVHPIISAGQPLSTDEMVTLLLCGIQRQDKGKPC